MLSFFLRKQLSHFGEIDLKIKVLLRQIQENEIRIFVFSVLAMSIML